MQKNEQIIALLAQLLQEPEEKAKAKRARRKSSGKRWTKNEVDAVFALHELGWSHRKIASAFRGRTTKSIEVLIYKKQKQLSLVKSA